MSFRFYDRFSRLVDVDQSEVVDGAIHGLAYNAATGQWTAVSIDESGSPELAVLSVNGQTGVVTLGHTDVGADAAGAAAAAAAASLPLAGGTMSGALVPRTLANLGVSGTAGEIAKYGTTVYSYTGAAWRRLGNIFTGTPF